jgi:selenium metabolism protein YedF
LDDGERRLILWVADELARSNVSRFAASRGASVEVAAVEDGSFKVTITAGEASSQARSDEHELLGCEVPPAEKGPTLVQITAETMGSGDDELGSLLMRSFVKTQVQLDGLPDTIIFYNGGARLCCADSVLLDDLNDLARRGVEILVCGTCLNFYGLADQLQVGRVTDMLEIAGRLAAAGHIIRP